MVLALFFLAGAKTIMVFTPFLYKEVVDRLALANTDPNLVVLVPVAIIASYGLARFMSIAFAQLRDMTFVRVSQHALRRLALETFRHLHELSLAFHLDRRTGGVSRIIERGTRSIDFLMRLMLFSIFPTIIEITLVTVIFLKLFGLAYALVLLAGVLLYAIFTFRITEWRSHIRRTMNKEDTLAHSRAIDSLLNFETVKYFNNEAHEADRYDDAMGRYQEAAVKGQSSLSLLNVGQALIIATALVIIMIFAARDALAGSLTVGDFVLANSLLIQLFMPLNFLGVVYRELKQGLIDIEQMFSLINTDLDVKDAEDACELTTTGGEIEFRNVSFSYQSERKILQDISFKVPAGGTVAVVGPSGAGKSTLSRILFRFYDIQAGTILIDGQDISKVTQKSLRRTIGIVPQDTVLFNESIRYNIEYGRPGASDKEIDEAASHAQITGFIKKLPEGYETIVGERGLKLSGGEKQRVAIARSILKDPPILVLDEATSALDTATEREIQLALKDVAKNRTTLVIAHRLSTVVEADEILVLDDGCIVERGRHGALLAQDGVYAAMWQRQQEAEEARLKLDVLEPGDKE